MSVEAPQTIVTLLTGSVRMPYPTGRWIQDAQGGWYEEHTPMRVVREDGSLDHEEPYQPAMTLKGRDIPNMLQRAGFTVIGAPPRPWWRRMLGW